MPYQRVNYIAFGDFRFVMVNHVISTEDDLFLYSHELKQPRKLNLPLLF